MRFFALWCQRTSPFICWENQEGPYKTGYGQPPAINFKCGFSYFHHAKNTFLDQGKVNLKVNLKFLSFHDNLGVSVNPLPPSKRSRSETEKIILEHLSSTGLSQFKKYHPSGNLRFNNLGNFQSLKLRILKSFQFLLSLISLHLAVMG